VAPVTKYVPVKDSVKTLQKMKGYMIPITNIHWNVSESDLQSLFGDTTISVKLKYDASGRSEGSAQAVFKTKELAEQAIQEFNGHALDGMILQFGEIKEWKMRTKKTSVFDRLAPKIEDRLGKGIEDRLGKKIDDRLGKKIDDRLGKKMDDRLGKKKKAKKQSKKMDTDEPVERAIKSYADTEVAANDGILI
jgi:RNA recognition motif-containing protein